jgi:hypothetical protein
MLDSYVVLPDGYQMSLGDALAKGFTVIPWPDSEKIATAHPHETNNVVLSRGVIVGSETARKAGFQMREQAAPPANSARAWRSAILTLPEANERPAAAVELVMARTPETLSVETARAFLRGLPVETTTTHQPEEKSMTDTDPRAARRAEITRSMAAFNQGRGYTARTALPVARQAAQPASLKHVEPAKLKRLAEIRLNAMEHNGKGRTQDAKLLRLALETHASVGTPFDRLCDQLGVDTSKLLPNSH